MQAFFVTMPHSGERVCDETPWLHNLPEEILMCDIDRYVDKLYQPAIEKLGVDSIRTEWHRYVVDLNRFPEDIDSDAVQGSSNPSGTFPKGLHWSVTTKGDPLITEPMSQELHQSLVKNYYNPFHQAVADKFRFYEEKGAREIFQLDAHSMPSVGEKLHRDPGEKRAEIVVSDVHGKSAKGAYKDLVIEAYEKAGFQVAYNWPYIGGRITERYGNPEKGHHAIQVEMNRALYMNETTKKIEEGLYPEIQEKVQRALEHIQRQLG